MSPTNAIIDYSLFKKKVRYTGHPTINRTNEVIVIDKPSQFDESHPLYYYRNSKCVSNFAVKGKNQTMTEEELNEMIEKNFKNITLADVRYFDLSAFYFKNRGI
jgi:hypothetical protein